MSLGGANLLPSGAALLNPWGMIYDSGVYLGVIERR